MEGVEYVLGALSFYLGAKMPYYNVRVSENVHREYVVCAKNRDDVEEILAQAIAAGKCDNKRIIHVRTDSDSGLSTYDAEKVNWTDALKKQKAK